MSEKATGDLAVRSRQDFPLVIAAMPISERETRFALGVVLLLLIVVVIVAPLANAPLTRIDTFIPVLQTVMCVVDLITAALLFAQYSIYPNRGLLAVASGYVFSGLFALLQTLAFPGAYSPTGVIGDGVNSAAWLFVLWHTTFDLAIIAYALMKDAHEASLSVRLSPTTIIAVTIVCILAVTAALTWIVTKGAAYLPTLYVGVTTQTPFAGGLDVFLWSLSALAFVLLLIRRRTILDLWLLVILLAWWPNFILPIFITVVRFTVGWYVARFFALFASSTLLCILLGETMVLYGRLANANLRLQRERADRLMSIEAATSALAHEVRQPLTGIVAHGSAGLRWLQRQPPNIEKASAAFTDMVDAGHRIEEILASIRGLFRQTDTGKAIFDLNDVTQQALSLAQHDLQIHDVSVTAEYQDNLPQISANRTQLQQVILNLIKNAIDAMDSKTVTTRRLRLVTGSNGNSLVSLYVQDTGPGISAENRDRVFDPFFTTKRTGMGLGLAICRTIIEEHSGSLRLAKTNSDGSSFEINLPATSTTTV